jgi:hypothetical protein
MARPSKHNWEEIKKHYEAGKNQAEIVLEFECPKSSLSEKIKSEKWIQSEQVKAYIKGSLEVNEQKANLIEQDVRIVEIADNIIDEQTRRRGLIFNATEALLKKATKMIEKNQTVDKLSCGDGIQNFEPRELNTTDLKNLSDTIDKASITLGVNQRHSNSQVNVNTQNNVNTNNTALTLEQAEKEALALGVPLEVLIR